MFLDNDCSLKMKCGVYPLPIADFEREGPSIDIPPAVNVSFPPPASFRSLTSANQEQMPKVHFFCHSDHRNTKFHVCRIFAMNRFASQ